MNVTDSAQSHWCRCDERRKSPLRRINYKIMKTDEFRALWLFIAKKKAERSHDSQSVWVWSLSIIQWIRFVAFVPRILSLWPTGVRLSKLDAPCAKFFDGRNNTHSYYLRKSVTFNWHLQRMVFFLLSCAISSFFARFPMKCAKVQLTVSHFNSS